MSEMFWRVLHDTLKWLWPALFAGAIAICTVAVASAGVWPEAKIEIGRVFTAGIAVLNEPISWLILVAVFVVWLVAFVWSGHKLSPSQAHGRNADMPLYLACRWIARDSAWAARLHPSRDGEWVSLVDAELMSKVNLGQVDLFGVPRNRGGALYPLPKDFTDHAQWHSPNLVLGDNPPTHMWASSKAQVSPSVYYDVRLDSQQVKRVWPRRGRWARLRGKSPIERIGDYRPIFRHQDAAYQKRHGYFDAPLEAHLREAME